jgi:triacylglycerol lipase
MPNSSVIMMKGLGHLPMIEQPGLTARDYLKFREGLEKKK